MAYTRINWQDGPSGGTPLSAANLNRMDQGIADAHDMTDALAPLEPHVADLLDIRIVDHNLDVPSPPNGRYIRYANGWQWCGGKVVIPTQTGPWFTTTYQGIEFIRIVADWVLPAEMVEIVSVGMSVDESWLYEAEPGDIRTYRGVATPKFSEEPGMIHAYIDLIKPDPFYDVFYSVPAYWSATGRWQ